MIRVPEDKAIAICIPYQLLEESGLLVHEDEVWVRVIEEQYNKIKASYDSRKYKKMNEDDSLYDLCELLTKTVRKAKWQRFAFDYPEDVARGLTFEAETKRQWDAEAFKEMADKVVADFLAEEGDALDAIAEAAYNDALNEEDYLDEIDELGMWMKERGFESGKYYYEMRDEADNYIGCLDLAWPFGVYGLQRGFTKPIALRIGATPEELKEAEEQGFTCFASIEEFKAFIEKNYK